MSISYIAHRHGLSPSLVFLSLTPAQQKKAAKRRARGATLQELALVRAATMSARARFHGFSVTDPYFIDA
jgi:hypothetical protein